MAKDKQQKRDLAGAKAASSKMRRKEFEKELANAGTRRTDPARSGCPWRIKRMGAIGPKAAYGGSIRSGEDRVKVVCIPSTKIDASSPRPLLK